MKIINLHGFYMEFQDALKASGYYEDKEPHKLIILGDLFDRGSEAKRLQAFILNNMENLILIRGNHEDLFEELVKMVAYNEITEAEAEEIAEELLKDF